MGKIILAILITAIFSKSFGSSQSCPAMFEKDNLAAVQEADLTSLKKQIEKDFLPSVARSWRSDMPAEIAALSRDSVEGPEKLKGLKTLGFKINGKEVSSPSYFEMINNYLQALRAQGLKIEDSILPALVLTKIDSHYQVHYYLMTPGIDSWPTEPGYEAGMAPQFNLPYEVILEAAKRGRFPLMKGTHDLFHFVSFINHPDYMRSLLLNTRKIGEPRPVKYMGFRLNYIQEWLALGDPNQKQEIKSRLQLFKQFPNISHKDSTSFDFYLSAMEALPNDKLREHAEQLKKNFPGFLIEYGGAVTRSKEKEDFSGLRGGNNFLDLFLDPKPLRTIDRVWRETPSLYIKTLTEILETLDLSDIEFREFLNKGFSWVFREKYAKLYKPGQNLKAISSDPQGLEPADDAKEQIFQMLRIHLARMEYSLWRSVNDVNHARFMDGLIRNGDGTVDPEVATFVKNAFGENSFFYSILKDNLSGPH
ncbi:MAG: hypothetical protein ACXVCY_18885 [Pseudobdellovibrionaceae bacterium]